MTMLSKTLVSVLNISQAKQDWKQANNLSEQFGGIEKLNEFRELVLDLPYNF